MYKRQPAAQRVGQRGQAGRKVIEHIVNARGRPTEAQKTIAFVAPHRVERIGQTEEQCARSAEKGEPEERADHRVVAVLQRRFDAGFGDAGFIERTGICLLYTSRCV